MHKNSHSFSHSQKYFYSTAAQSCFLNAVIGSSRLVHSLQLDQPVVYVVPHSRIAFIPRFPVYPGKILFLNFHYLCDVRFGTAEKIQLSGLIQTPI